MKGWNLPMWLLPSTVRFQPDSARQRSHNLHETYQLPRVQLITPDDGHSRCPKHAEFRDKITFWILDASCWLFIRREAVLSAKLWYIYTKTHGVTTHKTIIFIMAIVRKPNVNSWYKMGGKKETRQPRRVQLWDIWIQVSCVTDALITPVELRWFRIKWTVSVAF
jgi:hypothetical protein